jgi:hypothetical protein
MAIERKKVEHAWDIEYHEALMKKVKDSKATGDSANKPDIITLD